MSADVILGVPSNVLQAAWLLKFVSLITGKEAGVLTVNLGDAHIYANHLEAAEMIIDQPVHENTSSFKYNLHGIALDKTFNIGQIEEILQSVKPGDITVTNYSPGIVIPKEKLPMAV
jgi:thymidylate synthase